MKNSGRFIVPLTFLIFCFYTGLSQKEKGVEMTTELPQLTAYDSIGLMNLPKLSLADFKGPYLPELPSVVDNSTNIHWRPVFAQVGLECGQASGVGLGFTYAINRLRNLPSDIPDNQYTTHFTWNFENGGQGWYGVSYFHSFEVIRTLGNPTVTTYGGMTSPSPYNMWMNGYDNYYQAMKNRIMEVYQIDVSDEAGIETLKHWLHNNLEGDDIGGVANFYSNTPSASYTLPAGTPEEGKYVVISWGGTSHSMTICGYNDSIRWDYNSDGQYTNHIDITGDGVVNTDDWEIGGLKFANTYSGGPTWANNGFSYMTYNSLAEDSYGGYGIWNHAVHVLYPKADCDPLLTAKITLKHTCREQIRVRIGVSDNQTSTTPDYIIGFPVFDFHGGCQYMQGGNSLEENKTIEFGLDLTPFLNLIGSNSAARYFLLVDEDDPNNWSPGQIISYSIIDYTSGVNEITCSQSNVPIVNNSLTKLWIDHNVSFGEITINDDVLPDAVMFEDYSHLLTASGGNDPYYWDLDLNFDESDLFGAFPNITSTQLSPTNNDDGYAVQNLDFSFPFHDGQYDQVRVYVDGSIMFESPFSWPYSKYDFFNFTKNKYIAPFLADLQLYPADSDGIWYQGDASSATFRWKAAVSGFASTTELNFAVRLYDNGDIRFYYGSVNDFSNLEWISGLSAGNNKYYQFTEISNAETIPSNYICDLSASFAPEEFSVNQWGFVEGKPENVYDSLSFKIRATDEHNITASKKVYISTGGSFLMLDTVMVNSGGDDIIEYGEQVDLTVRVKCLGDEVVTGANMSILLDDPYITIFDNLEFLGNFNPGETKLFTNAFAFDIHNNIPNQYALNFQTTIDDSGGHEWINSFELTAYAPVLEADNVVVSDINNGTLDPGETCFIIVDLSNVGGATAYNLISSLTTTDLFVTINDDTDFLSELFPYSLGATATFNVSVANDALIGHSIDFSMEVNADFGISTTYDFSLIIGQLPILIVDLDPNHNSAPSMETAMDLLNVSYEKTLNLPADPSDYSGLFVCLGIYSSNHVLTSGAGIE